MSQEDSRNLGLLNRNQIKYLVIIAMVIDHIAWDYVPLMSLKGQIMHFIGRLTAPVMSFFLAEGFIHTHNKRKYAIRLFVFMFISWVAFDIHAYGYWPELKQSVIFTFFISFINLWVWDGDFDYYQKIMATIVLCYVSAFADWGVFGVLWSLIFYLFHDRPVMKWVGYYIIALIYMVTCISNSGLVRNIFQMGVFVVPLLIIFLYNGEGGSRNPFHKWFFYVFYPLHLMILYYLKTYILIS